MTCDDLGARRLLSTEYLAQDSENRCCSTAEARKEWSRLPKVTSLEWQKNSDRLREWRELGDSNEEVRITTVTADWKPIKSTPCTWSTPSAPSGLIKSQDYICE